MATEAPIKTGPRRPEIDNLYCINEDGSRNTIHTADVKGRYQVRKKILWGILIALYLVLPWIEIGGHPAVLINIAERRAFFFGFAFTAQDFYLSFFIVSGIGFTLFVVSALFGRIWCGYGCPHTVFLEGVYRRVERWLEGGAAARKKLAESPWNANKVLRRGGKWAVFLAISLVLSHTMLAYFLGMDEVLKATTSSPSEHSTAFIFILIFTAIIYFNFAWFREQMCIVLCPYGRLQGVLYDEDTVNVGYDKKRGETRGKYTQEDRGDCIDCYRCVAVCPTGIDIRNGTQLECVGCANCIDACDEVMTKVGQPTGLVRYDSQRGFEKGKRQFWRPRLLFYAVLLIAGITAFAVVGSSRMAFEAHLQRQSGASFTATETGARNGYFIHVLNKEDAARNYTIVTTEEPGLEFVIPMKSLVIPAFKSQKIPIFITASKERLSTSRTATIVVRAETGEEQSFEAKLSGPAN